VRADKIGKRWGYEASRLTDNETFHNAAQQARAEANKCNPYKYRLYCPDCGAEWKYKTNCDAVRRADKYRCSKCKTNLKSEKI
jgi:predicted SprT family Zn-dependent metalloprotease